VSLLPHNHPHATMTFRVNKLSVVSLNSIPAKFDATNILVILNAYRSRKSAKISKNMNITTCASAINPTMTFVDSDHDKRHLKERENRIMLTA